MNDEKHHHLGISLSPEKTSEMKSFPSGLTSHIALGQTTLTTLFKITRRDGTVLGFTEHDVDLVSGGVTYLSNPGYSRFNLNESSDGEAKTTELIGAIDSIITRADIQQQLYDSANFQLLLANWANIAAGTGILCTGSFGPVSIEEFQYRVELRGLAYRLKNVGGRVCGPMCPVDFGSAQCAPGGALADGTTINSLLQSGTVVSVSGNSFVFSGLTNPNKPDGGNCTFTSGSNNHLSSQIKTINWGTSTITLQPGALLAAPITPGDTFSYFPACDFTFFTCVNSWANGLNFQGEPSAPSPDAVLDYPDYVAPH